MRKISRVGIAIASVAGAGIFACAYAQMMPPSGGAYTPPSGGGSAGGGTTYTPPGGGGTGTGTGTGTGGFSYYAVTITKSGSGSGAVTATGAMINCGSACSAQVMGGAVVTLTQSADAGSVFAGWSGACAGTGACSVSVASDVAIGAIFNTEPAGSGGDDSSGGGEGSGGGDDRGYQYQYPTYASDFQNQFDQPVVKKVKKKTVFKGYTPVIGQIQPMDKPFTGAVIGSNWKLAGAAGEETAQGVTVGKGSRTTIRVNMTTGTVTAQFEGKSGCWMASYYGDQGAERKELYKCGGDSYQEELLPDGQGGGARLALLMHKGTLYGDYAGGSFFMVPRGGAIDVPPAAWIEGSIPSAKQPLIPIDRILQLVAEKAQAAERQLSAVEIYRLVGTYRTVQAGMYRIQQQFASIDLNSSLTDYAAVQELVDKYQALETQIGGIARQLGLASAFVRDGYWLASGSPVAAAIAAQGVDAVPAGIFAQARTGFDFYVLPDGDAPFGAAGGTCAVSYDENGYPAVSCVPKRVAAADALRAEAARDLYRASVASANRAMNGVEKALFSGAGQ